MLESLYNALFTLTERETMKKGTKAIYRIFNDDGDDIDVFTIQHDPRDEKHIH